MAAEPDVHSRAVRQRFLRVDHAVAVRVAKAPEVGRHRGEQIALVPEDVVEGVGDEVVEVLEHERGLVRHAVAVRVLDAVEPFLGERQVTPVARPVPVEVLQPLVLRAAFRCQHVVVEGALVLHVLERDRRDHPVLVAADVDLTLAGPARAGREQPSLVVERDADWIGNHRLGSPQVQLEAGRETGGDCRAIGLRERRRRIGGELDHAGCERRGLLDLQRSNGDRRRGRRGGRLRRGGAAARGGAGQQRDRPQPCTGP